MFISLKRDEKNIHNNNFTERDKFIQVIDFDFLMLSSNIRYLFNNVTEFFLCFARERFVIIKNAIITLVPFQRHNKYKMWCI